MLLAHVLLLVIDLSFALFRKRMSSCLKLFSPQSHQPFWPRQYIWSIVIVILARSRDSPVKPFGLIAQSGLMGQLGLAQELLKAVAQSRATFKMRTPTALFQLMWEHS